MREDPGAREEKKGQEALRGTILSLNYSLDALKKAWGHRFPQVQELSAFLPSYYEIR